MWSTNALSERGNRTNTCKVIRGRAAIGASTPASRVRCHPVKGRTPTPVTTRKRQIGTFAHPPAPGLTCRGALRASEHGHEGVLEFLRARREAVHGLVDAAVAEDDAGALDAALEEMLAPGLGVLTGALVDALAGQVDLHRHHAAERKKR